MNPKFDNYKKTLLNSVSQRENVEKYVKQILNDKKIENIFLVGCGGSLAVMNPCKYIITNNSNIPIFEYNSGEFTLLKPKNVNQNSLVIFSSLSGKTKETVRACEYANSLGATTIGFAAKKSPLGENVDFIFNLNNGDGVNESQIIILYLLIFTLLKYTENKKYDEIFEVINTLPENLVNFKVMAENKAEAFAKENKNEDFFMVIGSGSLWGEAYSFATCNLEEMQWIIAQPVHAGEFFHGSFEIVREDTNLIIFNGEDKTRKLVDRVINFAKKYSKKITVIDSKEYEFINESQEIRQYFSPIIISAVKDVYFRKLAHERNHPAHTRRYMGKVNY